MSTLLVITHIVLSMAISLGVGASTIAIANFFTAISDGTIEPAERRIMGTTYWVLRAAMVLITITLLTHYMYGYAGAVTQYFGTTLAFAAGVIVSVLYLNAILMTWRVMPSTFGPAIQASSWYTLGTLATLGTIGISQYSWIVFGLGYVTAFLLFLGIVNGAMAIIRHRSN